MILVPLVTDTHVTKEWFGTPDAPMPDRNTSRPG